ncbi:very long-chain specific acyl-CoA dehydrogenase, mitochondrial [Photinus pyralis]|uniref:Very long-chain specific acyl-CoA dehydrogenase, mitochondrial n=1 Tax=Photinus pyralis TaxID=7054 RepID=A0A1Y1KZ03_PHOPY|nr:very long-chain specific acyl-CoA dehydrogenase, mitochondrial [Photinus pyralis]
MLQVAKFVRANLRHTRCLASTAAPQPKNAPEKEPSPASENLSFTLNLFRGQLEAREVFPFPNPLNEDQRDTVRMLIDPVAKFFEEINNAKKNDELESIEEKSLTALWDLGFFATQAPTELGGLGLTNTQAARVVEIVGKHDLGLAVTLAAHQSIGFKGILLYGTPEQKEKYVPRLTTGDFAAFCLTEPSSGSDAASIRTRAELSPDGKHYILNGSKIWISNGGLAKVMTVFAQTSVTDPKTGERKDKVTSFIVERAFGGVTSGPPEKKMGIKGSNTTEVFFEDVKVPVENVLGGVGNGFKVAMNILNNGRFGMAACLAGTMKACVKKATEFAVNRTQFGEKLRSFQGIREKLARMATLQYVTESLAYMIAGNMDNGSQHYHLETAISKCVSSEAAWNVCDEAIQIMGGMGFMKETGLEQVMRDLRIFRIFEGTNDILRLLVALTGIQYAGAHLKELQKAFKNPAANLGVLLEEASKRVVRSVGLSSPPQMDHLVHKDLASSANLLSKSIDTFGQSVEALLIKHGKSIVHQQSLLNRLANCTFDIYTSVVILSRCTQSLNNNLPSAQHEKQMTQAWIVEATERVKHTLECIRKGDYIQNIDTLSDIGNQICESGGIIHPTPLNF